MVLYCIVITCRPKSNEATNNRLPKLTTPYLRYRHDSDVGIYLFKQLKTNYMSLKTLIQSIGHFFEKLFGSTRDAFNELPKEQQDAIVSGVNVAEIIKEMYGIGEDNLIRAISQKLLVSESVSKAVIMHVLKSLGINTDTVQDGLDNLAGRVENTITDDGWNGLWESVAKFAASWMSTGKLNWVTLGLGVVEFAYQKIFKGVE